MKQIILTQEDLRNLFINGECKRGDITIVARMDNPPTYGDGPLTGLYETLVKLYEVRKNMDIQMRRLP